MRHETEIFDLMGHAMKILTLSGKMFDFIPASTTLSEFKMDPVIANQMFNRYISLRQVSMFAASLVSLWCSCQQVQLLVYL